MNGRAERPATELMLTTRPREALRSGRNAWVTATTPTTFTSSTRRSSSSGSSSSGPTAGIPALLTSPARGAPASARSTSARARAMPGWSVTSMISGVMPACASAAPSDSRRTVPNTRKPRPASSRAMLAPMPDEAPVTTTPAVTRTIYDLRASVAARARSAASTSPSETGAGTLVRLDHERPRAFLRPHPFEGEHALPRGLRELELHRLPLAVHDPFRRARDQVPHRPAMVERVHQQERPAHRLVVRVHRQFDRDPRRPRERGGGGGEGGARERREGEA